MTQYQRNPDGTSNPSSSYPPIPDATEFFTGYRYEVPVEIHYWCWRTDYNRWGACVSFPGLARVITNPKPKEQS